MFEFHFQTTIGRRESAQQRYQLLPRTRDYPEAHYKRGSDGEYYRVGRDSRRTLTNYEDPRYYGHRRRPTETWETVVSASSQQDELPEKAALYRPVGFWSAALSETRKDVFKHYGWTLSYLCVFVFGVLSIYWGVLSQVKEKLHNATIAVVSFDGLVPPYEHVTPIVGPAIIEATLAEFSKFDHLGFETQTPEQWNNDPMAVRLAVHSEKIWGAIIINANATALLREAVETGNSSYDPLGAAQIFYNQARDVESYNQYVIPPLTELAMDVIASFGRNWTHQVLTNSSLNITTYSKSPQALSPGIGFSFFNIRPFDPPTAIPAISIGLIYLIIIAFFSFSFFMPIHMKFVLPNPASPHPPLKFNQLILWRYTATVTAYFFLSLCYSLVSLVFLIPFNNIAPAGGWPKGDVANNADHFGRATFIVYWLLNFFGMTALGLACENVAMLIGQPWTALWLIFWVITNVSTGFYALDLASDFFKWGHVWPLRQIVYASRTLLFGTNDNLGYNFGILVMWIVAGTITFPFCCHFMRRKAAKAAATGKN